MKIFSRILGVVLIIAGIAVGVYVDIRIFLIGGIMQVVDGFNATPNDGSDIAWGLVKALVLTGMGLAATIVLLVMPGFALLGFSMKKRVRRRF